MHWEASAVFHFAAQVAVTTSLLDPRCDFEVNAMGTLNVLEALRSLPSPIPLIFTSTNKVYGSLKDVTLLEDNDRYEPKDESLRSNGIGENRGLEFYSPYGCSKGTADQYVLDFARLFGLPALVFRMSCVYGPHQLGTEDQGWVAHFLLQANERINDLTGEAFNIGGGTGRTISLLELISLIASLNGVAPRVAFEDWRPGDQRYYATNFSKFNAATGWIPETSVEHGIGGLYAWLQGSDGRQRLAAIS
ncbi:MAG TPA: GDP-mannose 4,6-dehydratase [Chthoniobacterales bacterium]